MSAYSREEMEEMMRRWLAVNDKAEQEGNWRHLADFYTDECVYGWDTPNGKYEFIGREVIRETCVGAAMDPYKGWTYPYDKIVIDEFATVVVFEQVPAQCFRIVEMVDAGQRCTIESQYVANHPVKPRAQQVSTLRKHSVKRRSTILQPPVVRLNAEAHLAGLGVLSKLIK